MTESGLRVLFNALSGIASCATECGCCAMHRRIADKAIAEFNSLTPKASLRDSDQRQPSFD